MSGNPNITYEEALVSKRHATEKAQQFPKDLIGLVLHMVQFKTLRVKELVSEISNNIKEIYLVGEISHRSKDRFLIPL